MLCLPLKRNLKIFMVGRFVWSFTERLDAEKVFLENQKPQTKKIKSEVKRGFIIDTEEREKKFLQPSKWGHESCKYFLL